MARKKNYEISEDQFMRAMAWLDNGGTKKGACDILGVTNNKTMERLIDEFNEKARVSKEMRAKKRTQAVTPDEVVAIITDYLNGSSYSELSDRYYRSANVIKHHIEKNGANFRVNTKINPLSPPALPEHAVSDSFEIGQYIWCSKYGCVGQVMSEYKGAYRIQVLGEGRQEYCYQPAWELGSLFHLENLGVNPKQFTDYLSGEETKYAINKTMLEANKNYRKSNR